MKWYWVVTNDNTVENPFVSDDGDLDGIEEWRLAVCEFLEFWSGRAWIRASILASDGDADDNLQNHFGLLIFSQRLQAALLEVNIRGIQYLPIQVIRPSGARLEGFCIANIIHCVAALDLDSSDYDTYPDDYFLPERRGQLNALRRAILKTPTLDGYDVVRLREYNERVYVSERFKNVFKANNFTGLSFHEVTLS